MPRIQICSCVRTITTWSTPTSRPRDATSVATMIEALRSLKDFNALSRWACLRSPSISTTLTHLSLRDSKFVLPPFSQTRHDATHELTTLPYPFVARNETVFTSSLARSLSITNFSLHCPSLLGSMRCVTVLDMLLVVIVKFSQRFAVEFFLLFDERKHALTCTKMQDFAQLQETSQRSWSLTRFANTAWIVSTSDEIPCPIFDLPRPIRKHEHLSGTRYLDSAYLSIFQALQSRYHYPIASSISWGRILDPPQTTTDRILSSSWTKDVWRPRVSESRVREWVQESNLNGAEALLWNRLRFDDSISFNA